jgi:predicted Zn-dependent peptidase
VYQKTTLGNGLRVLTGSMPHTRSVCVALFLGVGSRYERDGEEGASHFIEHVLFRGTPERPTAHEISEAIEGVGGILNGATDKELTFYWCKVTREHFKKSSEVLVYMLFNSKFEPDDIEKERQVIIEEIHMCKDSPSQQVGMLIDELLWPDHPLGRDIAGTKESMAGIDRKKLRSYLKAKYTPRNTVVAITGNVQHEEVVEIFSKLLGSWTNAARQPTYLAYQEKSGERLKIEKRETEQAHLCLALPGVSLSDPRRFSLDMLNVVLGEGMSSRLFSEVRDKLGLAYSISSYVEHLLDSGSLVVSASVDPSNLKKAIKAILDELSKVKDGIPEAEMNKAREISKGRLLLRMEDSRNVAGWLGGQETLLNSILTLDDIVAIINAVTAEQLQKVAREIIVAEKLRLAVVGPISSPAPLKELLKLK